MQISPFAASLTGMNARYVACAWLALGTHAAWAGSVSFEAGRVELEGLEIEGLASSWSPAAGARGAFTLRAARVRGLAATGPLAKFALDCQELAVAGDEIRCDRGRLSGSLGSLGAQDSRFTAKRRADGTLSLAFDAFAIAGGRGRLDVEVDGPRWRADAKLDGLDLGKAAGVARPWISLPPDFTVAGQASGEFRAAGIDDALREASADATIATLDFA